MIKLADHVMTGTRVGVTCCRPPLTTAQLGNLGRVLAGIGLTHDGPLVLHHGCSPGADEVAHRIVRKLGGWRIHGHPGRDVADGSPGRVQDTLSDLDVVHESKPHSERNADIVNVSHILVAVLPYPEDDPRSLQSETWMMIRMGRAAGREIIYVPRKGRAQEPNSRKATRQGAVTIAAGAKDVKWATRQGRMDRKAGTACQRYQHFRSTYRLSESKLTHQMWTAYVAKTATQKKRNRVRSVWTVSGGLPTLGKGAR